MGKYTTPPEPVVKDKTFENNTEYTNVLNWYTLMTLETAKEYLLEWIKKDTTYEDGYAKMSKVPVRWINKTAGKIARIITRGGCPPESSWIFIYGKCEEMFKKIGTTDEDADKETPQASVQSRIKDKAGDLIAVLEGMIDDGDTNKFDRFFIQQGVSSLVAQKLLIHFEPIMDELTAAVEKTDPEIVEGYTRYTKKGLEKVYNIYKSLFDALESHAKVSRKPRAPRKRKPLTAEKLMKHFKYCDKDAKLSLASIHPERIIGAQELWTYNTKTKVLAVYRAIDRGGLSINRTSITKYDEKQSVAKRIGRKTEEILKSVQEGGKITLRKLMDTINSDPQPISRINAATILLRTS